MQTLHIQCLKRALNRPSHYVTSRTSTNAAILTEAGVPSAFEEQQYTRLQMSGHVARHPEGPTYKMAFGDGQPPTAIRQWVGG